MGYIICPNCGHSSDSFARFCTRCGNPIVQVTASVNSNDVFAQPYMPQNSPAVINTPLENPSISANTLDYLSTPVNPSITPPLVPVITNTPSIYKLNSYTLLPHEYVLIQDQVQRNGLARHVDNLILTTNRLIYEKFNAFNKVSEVIVYPFNVIKLVLANNAPASTFILTIRHTEGETSFEVLNNNPRRHKIWTLALNDRMDICLFDQFFYPTLDDEYLARKIQANTDSDDPAPKEKKDHSKARFAGDVAAGIITSGFTPTGIAKSIVRAQKKQIRRDVANSIKETIAESTFVEDSLLSLENSIKKEFGLKTKKTRAEIMEDMLNKAFQDTIDEERQRVLALRNPTSMVVPTIEESFDDKVEKIKKYKELLDAGILSQEEFDIKKSELLEL